MIVSVPHFVRRGAGTPVLLIQGARAGHLHWGERFLTALSRRCAVVAYDHSGLGGSADVTDRSTMADLADDAARVLDAVGWSTAAVFGVSLGGVVAQELALRQPGRVQRLVLGGSNAGGAGSGTRGAGVDAQFAAALVPGDRSATSDNLFRLGVKDATAIDAQAWRDYRTAEAVPANGPAILAQMAEYARHSTVSRLPQLRVPTLVVHGDADRIIDLEDAVTLARAIPGARLQVLSAGHFFWLERPDEVAELVAEFCVPMDERAEDQAPASGQR